MGHRAEHEGRIEGHPVQTLANLDMHKHGGNPPVAVDALARQPQQRGTMVHSHDAARVSHRRAQGREVHAAPAAEFEHLVAREPEPSDRELAERVSAAHWPTPPETPPSAP